MISKDDLQEVAMTSLYFHELFKKTILFSAPKEIDTKTQMNALIALYTSGPVTMSTLSIRLSIAPEQTTRVVKALREKNIVSCQRNPDNRREVLAQLTPKGIKIMNNHTKELKTRLEMCIAGIDDEDVETLVQTSKTLNRIFKKTELGENVI